MAAALRAAPLPAARRSPRLLSTFAGQSELPGLPVPTLAETLPKYLRSVTPLLTPQELRRTTAAVHASRPTLIDLQHRLEARARRERNWLEPWWDGGQYLDARMSAPINYNYFLRFNDEEHALPPPASAGGVADARQVARAARLLRGMAEFALALDDESVPADREGGRIVDMNQYARLFGHARVPARGGDAARCAAPRPSSLDRPHFRTAYGGARDTHAVALVRGRFFRVEVFADAGGGRLVPLPAQDIARGLLQALAAAAAAGDAPHPVAALTAMDRDAWADARAALAAASPANAASLDAIDAALWVVCLDDSFGVAGADVVGAEEARPLPPLGSGDVGPGRGDGGAWGARLTAESPRFLHGAGGGGDRWFDKHCLVVSRDGAAALLLEHAGVDGLTVVRVMNYVAAALAAEGAAEGSGGGAAPSSADLGGVPPPPPGALRVDVGAAAGALRLSAGAGEGAARELPFVVPSAVAAVVARARAQLGSAAAGLTTSVLHAPAASRAAIKDGMRLSPDAFAQMALQLAHAKLSGAPAAPTYESTSTRGFAHGRTEVTRSASIESAALVAALAVGAVGAPGAARRDTGARRRAAALLADACAAHVRYATESRAGRGVDRHLLGLRMIALETGAPLPPLFTDPAYDASRTWRLSTSHCGSDRTSLFGFGPVNDDCIGVGYAVTGAGATFNVTTWGAGRGGGPGAHAAAFTAALTDAIDALASVGRDHKAWQADIAVDV